MLAAPGGKLITMARQESAKAPDDGFELVADNRKARHDFFIEESLECGLALTGTEVKSLRAQGQPARQLRADQKRRSVPVLRAYRRLRAGWTIQPQGNPPTQAADASARDRSLWGHAREQNYTMVPLKIYSAAGAPRSNSASPRARSSTTNARRSSARPRGAKSNANCAIATASAVFARVYQPRGVCAAAAPAGGASPPASPSIARSRSIRRGSGG
jgi:SsrA-binding protein